MKPEIFWSLIALLALGGWAVTLVSLARSLPPIANAFNTFAKVDEAFDRRVVSLIERAKGVEKRNAAAAKQQGEDGKTLQQKVEEILEGRAVEHVSIHEQPDSDEIVD